MEVSKQGERKTITEAINKYIYRWSLKNFLYLPKHTRSLSIILSIISLFPLFLFSCRIRCNIYTVFLNIFYVWSKKIYNLFNIGYQWLDYFSKKVRNFKLKKIEHRYSVSILLILYPVDIWLIFPCEAFLISSGGWFCSQLLVSVL